MTTNTHEALSKAERCGYIVAAAMGARRIAIGKDSTAHVSSDYLEKKGTV